MIYFSITLPYDQLRGALTQGQFRWDARYNYRCWMYGYQAMLVRSRQTASRYTITVWQQIRVLICYRRRLASLSTMRFKRQSHKQLPILAKSIHYMGQINQTFLDPSNCITTYPFLTGSASILSQYSRQQSVPDLYVIHSNFQP